MAIYRTWSVVPTRVENPLRMEARKDMQAVSKPHAIPVRVWETEKSWLVVADVPGVAADAIGIEFFQERLTLRYERRPEETGTMRYDDLASGQFERVIRISDEIQPDRIVAKCENGVLRLELPKSEAMLPRKIHVTGESSSN